MTYKEGQKVVCVNASFTQHCAVPLKKGVFYTGNRLYQCSCSSHQIALREYTQILTERSECSRMPSRRQTYDKWRFLPLSLYEESMAIPAHNTEEKEVQIDQAESSK